MYTISVSYTHLDVYKRQTEKSVEKNKNNTDRNNHTRIGDLYVIKNVH